MTEVTVPIRVKPGASRVRVGGIYEGRFGPALIVAVTARAVDGAATEATRVALAAALGVRPANLTLRTGAMSRDKLFVLAAAPSDVADRLAQLYVG